MEARRELLCKGTGWWRASRPGVQWDAFICWVRWRHHRCAVFSTLRRTSELCLWRRFVSCGVFCFGGFIRGCPPLSSVFLVPVPAFGSRDPRRGIWLANRLDLNSRVFHVPACKGEFGWYTHCVRKTAGVVAVFNV
jgi:hypothetical protein